MDNFKQAMILARLKARVNFVQKQIDTITKFNKSSSKQFSKNCEGGRSLSYWEGLKKGYQNSIDIIENCKGL